MFRSFKNTLFFKTLKVILLFQKKIVLISYCIAIVLGILFTEKLIVGFSYLLIAPLIHFFLYNIKSKYEYYYYYNLGISNATLWSSTIVIGILNLIILAII